MQRSVGGGVGGLSNCSAGVAMNNARAAVASRKSKERERETRKNFEFVPKNRSIALEEACDVLAH